MAMIMFAAALSGALTGGDDDLRKAVTLYASFDDAVQADFARGKSDIGTRSGTPKSGQFTFAKGFSKDIFKIAKGKGIAGGCLEVTDILPDSGRIYFPMKDNIAFKKGGWGGAVSCWINTDPNTLFKGPFCDPVQITHRGANNGGIWFDFNNAKPKRDLRMGMFPAVPKGEKGASEDDKDAPMVRVPGIDFKKGDWHHVVLSWTNFDTGKPDAHATLYIDGKRIGDVKDRPIAMDWDVENGGIYVAVNFIGLLDEFAVFNRPLTMDEVTLLHKEPGVLSKLKR